MEIGRHGVRGMADRINMFVFCVVILSFLSPLSVHGQPAEIALDFDEDGLAGVSFDGIDVLSDPAPKVIRVVMSDKFRDRNTESQKREMYVPDDRNFSEADTEIIKRRFDPGKKVCTLELDWGEVIIDYQPGPEGLDFHVEVINESDKIIEYVRLKLLELNFPGQVETEWVRKLPRWAVSECNIGGPDLLRALYRKGRQSGQVLWLSTQPNRPMRQRLQRRGEDRWEVQARAGNPERGVEVKSGRNGFDGIWDSRPIRPGGKDEYELSLRFAPGDADPYELASDVYRRFGEAYPSTFQWPDRRPIAAVHVADSHSVSEENPRGWRHGINPPDGWSIEDENSHEVFYEAAMKGAERIIDVCKRMGAQGVVVWQVEGMEFQGPAYYGEPRHLRYVAPEMDAAADDFFAKIKDAGLRVGITIRPPIHLPRSAETGEEVKWAEMTKLVGRNWMPEIPRNSTHLYDPEEAWCVLNRLANKIEYARKRWGATLFYLDTNSFWRPRVLGEEGPTDWQTKRLPAAMFGTLNKMFPDVLIIPEHQYPEYWAHGAQYQHVPGMFGTITPPGVRYAYPESFSVITGDTGHILENRANYVRAAVEGDTFWGHGWFGGSMEKINALFQPAVKLAPYHVEVDAEEKEILVTEREVAGLQVSDVLDNDAEVEVVGREKFGELEALTEFFTKRLEADGSVPQRRVYVRYEEGISPEALNAVLDAITAGGGIIAWSQAEED